MSWLCSGKCCWLTISWYRFESPHIRRQLESKSAHLFPKIYSLHHLSLPPCSHRGGSSIISKWFYSAGCSDFKPSSPEWNVFPCSARTGNCQICQRSRPCDLIKPLMQGPGTNTGGLIKRNFEHLALSEKLKKKTTQYVSFVGICIVFNLFLNACCCCLNRTKIAFPLRAFAPHFSSFLLVYV